MNPTWTPCFFVLVCRQRFEDRITSRLESGLASISSMLILPGNLTAEFSVQNPEFRVQGSGCRALESCAQLQVQQPSWARSEAHHSCLLLHRHVCINCINSSPTSH